MIQMFDGAPPDPTHLSNLWRAGYRVAGAYVGGPSLYLPDLWHAQDISAARSIGFAIVGFYVGYDGNHLEAAQAAGLRAGDIFCLDVEGGAPATYAQQARFSADARGAGFRSGLYGSVATTNAMWASFDCIIAANYTGSSTPPSTNVAPGSVASCPQGWQWRGTFTEPFSGSTIDATVADPWFGFYEDTMNLDIARSLVFVRLSGEGLLQNQAQIDAYAGPMAQPGANPEAKLTDLNNDIAANPSSLSNRVKTLEEKVAGLSGAPSAPDDDSALDSRISALESKVANVKAAL